MTMKTTNLALMSSYDREDLEHDGVGLQMHPIVEAFPKMSADEFEGLKASIKDNGQLEPIRVWDGQIIDGRHRYLAAQELGLEPITINVDCDEAQAQLMAVSLNANRRNLTTSQRAGVALALFGDKMATRTDAGAMGAASRDGRAPDFGGKLTVQEVAAAVGVSASTIESVKAMVREDPDNLQRLIDGEITARSRSQREQSQAQATRQFVYVITASHDDSIVKVGISGNPTLRARQLEVTPFQSFTVAHKSEVKDAYRVEQAVHVMAELRGHDRLEFSNGEVSEWFKMTVDEAVALIETVLG